jgi:cell fate (sporulation/competence/biofilm development) regulator YlbF (YheA/YmcA/DUF963 family)
MQTITEANAILEKTRELCQVILDQPEFQTIRQRITDFMSDEEAKSQYQFLSEQGEVLQLKQQQGLPLTQEEIAEFENRRETFLTNPTAKGFLDARQQMQQMQESVDQYVAKTFELGRLPEENDFQSGSCGSGCGCH